MSWGSESTAATKERAATKRDRARIMNTVGFSVAFEETETNYSRRKEQKEKSKTDSGIGFKSRNGGPSDK